MSDGGGARATVELLLLLHSFKNVDLRSRGQFCVEAIAFPQSAPKSPGVPFRTYCDPTARRSAARGVAVAPFTGDVGQPGAAGTSAAGLPAYTSSLLPIRFTNEKVQLSEGASFRIHLDADWLETDVITVEFRLMYRALPEGNADPKGLENVAPSEEAPPPEPLKEVGKVTLHAKCAAAKGGLHRYHPLVFTQPYLCLLDVTFHMALTAINHPGGPAGLAAAIAANAFPSEDLHPAPRGPMSPARASTPTGSRTQARSASAGRLSHGSVSETPPSVRPRFQTPGRSRRSTFGGNSTGGWCSSSPTVALRPRVPMTAAALEAAGRAVGLATALGYAPAALDPDRGGASRAIYRAAELLYSRHALGLKWSQGTLAVAEAAATAAAAEVAAAAVNAAETALAAAKKKGGGQHGVSRKASSSSRSSGQRTVSRKSVPLPTDTNAKDLAGGSSHGGLSSDGVAPSPAGKVRPRRSSTGSGSVRAGGVSGGKPPTAAGATAGGAGSELVKGKATVWSTPSPKPPTFFGSDEEADPGEAWTWQAPPSPREKVDISTIPLPSDVRQLSRVIHARLSEESAICSGSWAAFATATFECGQRGLYSLRETWVRETQRAWSGQCIEILSMDRADLLKLDEAFLEPDGFVPLRARAGIRLRRRASPTRGGSRKRQGRRRPRKPLQVLESAQAPAGGEDGAVAPPRRAGSAVKAAQAMLEAPRLTNGRSSNRRDSSQLVGVSIAAKGGGDSCGAGDAAYAGSSKEGKADGRSRGVLSTNVITNHEEEVGDDDDEGPPPLLDALERRIPRSSLTPGTVVFTPRSSPVSSPWRTVSPWGGGSASSSFRNADQGWFVRLATGGTGSSSPTVSGGGAGGGAAAGAGGEGRGSGPIGSGAVTSMSMQFPPPPMSLLPLFDRDLHGFEAAAPADDRWTELPFVVVESWGGLEFEEGSPTDEKECVPDSSVSPCSPAGKSSADEFRRFQRIASGSFQENPSKIVTTPGLSNDVLNVGNGKKVESNVFDDEILIKDRRGDFRPVNGGRELTTSSTPDHDTSSTVAASVADDEDGPPGLPDLVPTPTTYKNAVRKPSRPSASPSADGGEAVRSPSSALPPASLVSVSSLTRSASSVALLGSPISMAAAARSLSRSLSRSPSLTNSPAGSPPDAVSASTASVRAPFADVALPPPPYSASAAMATTGGASSLHPLFIEGNKLLTTPARTRSRSLTGSPATIHRTPGKGTPSGSRRGGLRSPVVTTNVGIFETPSRPRQPRSPVNVIGAARTPSRAHGSRSPARPAIGGTPPRAPRSPTKADEKAGSIWDVPSSSSKKPAAGRALHHVTRRPLRLSSLPPRGDSMENTSGSLFGGSSTTNSSGKFRLIERAESLGSDFGGCSSGDEFFDDESDGARGTKGKRRRKSKRAEIRRKMWGRRPSWATALLVQQQTGSIGLAASGPAGTDARVRAAVSAASPAAGTSGAQESGTTHLVVLVHGLGGRPADMALMRGYLQALMPGAELMVATSLQDIRKYNSGVEALGHKLAEEVHEHITRFCPYFATHAPFAASSSRDNSSSLPLSPVTPLRVRDGAKKGSISTPGDRGTPGLGQGGSKAEGSRRHGNAGGVSDGVAVGSGSGNNSKGILSFVCFSMGGLVTRSALLEPAMVPYLSSLHCFVTLACPHLGQSSTPLSFFKTGAWAFRKLTGLRVLHELDLDDAEDPRETALYRLSFSPGLERFRTIVFAANPRDGFVPLHSASVRLSPPSADSSDSRTKQASAEMAEMLMSKVDERKNRVVRMTLDNPKKHAQSKSALDSMIGRAGHMCFIDSPQVAWLMSLALLPFLEESPRR